MHECFFLEARYRPLRVNLLCLEQRIHLQIEIDLHRVLPMNACKSGNAERCKQGMQEGYSSRAKCLYPR